MGAFCTGDRFGDYVVEGAIATGGMGAVYAAKDSVYGRAVALKVLHEHLHREADWRRRFNIEGQLGERLKHPNILAARELVVHEGRVGLVLDLVPGGQTLGHIIGRDWPAGLPPVRALQVFRGILAGVEYLHSKSVIHGDLKPENILIEGDVRDPSTWRPMVTDFGTVGLIAEPVMVEGQPAVVASPRYASPEHFLGVGRLSPQSDVYSLGLLLHFLLSGRHASGARNIEQAFLFVHDPVPLSLLVDQRSEVLSLTEACVATIPEDRPASCRALALQLREVLDELGARLDVADVKADLATEVDDDRVGWQRRMTAHESEDPVPSRSVPRIPEEGEVERTASFEGLPPEGPDAWEHTQPIPAPVNRSSSGIGVGVGLALCVALFVLGATIVMNLF